MRPVIEIDGKRFNSLDGFWDEISHYLIPGAYWGRNFDAFNDILRGGFGTPEGGFTLRWVNFEISRETLGYPETVRWLKLKIQRCHPQSVAHVEQEIEAARRGEGMTVADILLHIVRKHGPGGAESEDGVDLELA